MARAFLELLGHLSKGSDINVYTLNPCLEVWDQGVPLPPTKDGFRYERRLADLGPREVYLLEDPFRLEDSGEMPALALWGRPGRENVRLLNAVTGCELVSKVEHPTKGQTKRTLLHQIQRDIAAREAERETIPENFDFAEDDSIVFFSCPGTRRELEIIAAEIWSLLDKDDTQRTCPDGEPLRLNDIAVILPPGQAEVYQSLIGSVFGEMHQIPHNIVDLPVGGEGRIAEAMELLLALPLGKFTRQELLGLATHPAVMARLPEASSDDWLGWCNALGIVHGADRGDHEDTYIEKDVLNWDQGLKRLALGAFMSGERSGDARIFQTDGRRYIPEEVPFDRTASAAQFGLLIRSLIEDARSARQDRRRLSNWMEFITAMLTTYLIPENDEDVRVLRNTLRRVNDLAEMELGGKKVAYRIPYELVRSELAGLSGSLGQYLVDGVVVSTFLPMRAIPFRVIFIAGLGEHQFPAADCKNLLDLRQARRRAGDVSPREQDNYMFLETLLSARDKLYLSYVSRDPLTGDHLEPSSVVIELRHMLERGYVPKERLEEKTREHTYPLRRYDDPHTRKASPPADRERRAKELGNDLRKFLKRTGASPEPRELRKKLPPPVWGELARVLGVIEPPRFEATEGTELDTLTVSIGAIRNFLECPLQGSARFLLRMRRNDDDGEEDILEKEDEPFEASRLYRAIVSRKVFMAVLASGKKLTAKALAAAYDEIKARYELKGALPTGVFAASGRREHLQILDNWREAYQHLTGGKAAVPKVLRFGPAREHADAVDEVFASVVLEIDGPAGTEKKKRRIALVGTTQPLLDFPTRTLVFLTGGKKPTHVLRGFLDHVLLSAAGVSSAHEYSVCLFAADGHEPVSVPFGAFTQESAQEYLTTLLHDMLSRVHAYLLPCDAFLELRSGGYVEIDWEKLNKKLDGLRDSVEYTSSQYGPIKNPELCYEPPTEEEAVAMIRRRFKPFVDKQILEEAEK